MLRFGIVAAEDFRQTPPGASLYRQALSMEHVSLQLLRTAVPASPAELIVFEALTKHMQFGGVHCTTYRGRLRDVDAAVNALLIERRRADSHLELHDWAASTALTSREWAASLFPSFPHASLIASDLTLFLVEATLPDGSTYILQPNGRGVQYIRRPFVIRLEPPERWLMLINRIMGKRALARLGALQLAIPPDWLHSDEERFQAASAVFRKVPLIHPEARLLASRDPRFSIRQHSAFEQLERPVDVIRTMNIFNPRLFAPAPLRQGARAVWKSLGLGGCWVLGRTAVERDGRNHVTVLERTETGFRTLVRMGDGSEIEELALSVGHTGT